MINSLISLASYGYFSGGGFAQIISQWEQQGVFSYIIPFLLIFSLVYGVLLKIKIFGDPSNRSGRTINSIIALSISLLSLQFELVPRFFSEIFPRLGVGLAIILVAIVLLGLFAPGRTWMTYTFFTIGAIVFIGVLIESSTSFGWWGSSLGNVVLIIQQWAWLILLIAILLIIVVGNKDPNPSQDTSSLLMKALTGDPNKGKSP